MTHVANLEGGSDGCCLKRHVVVKSVVEVEEKLEGIRPSCPFDHAGLNPLVQGSPNFLKLKASSWQWINAKGYSHF